MLSRSRNVISATLCKHICFVKGLQPSQEPLFYTVASALSLCASSSKIILRFIKNSFRVCFISYQNFIVKNFKHTENMK